MEEKIGKKDEQKMKDAKKLIIKKKIKMKIQNNKVKNKINTKEL